MERYDFSQGDHSAGKKPAADAPMPDNMNHALGIALGALKKQNDGLMDTNIALIESNAALAKQNEEFKKYCSSISDMADILVTMKQEVEEEKRKLRDIKDNADVTGIGLLTLIKELQEKNVISGHPITRDDIISAIGDDSISAAPWDGVSTGISDLY